MLKTSTLFLISTGALLSIAQSSHAATVNVSIDFDNLAQGTVVNTQYSNITFLANPGFDIVIDSTYGLGTSDPNTIAVAVAGEPSQARYNEDIFFEFDVPVSGLQFYVTGDNLPIFASAKIYTNDSSYSQVDLSTDGIGNTKDLIDLSFASDITKVEIFNVKDPSGLSGVIYDDFSFEYQAPPNQGESVPEPTAIFGLLAFAGAGLLGSRKKVK